MTLPKPVIKPSVGASLKPVAVTASTAGQLVVKNVSQKVAKVFGDDDDDSEVRISISVMCDYAILVDSVVALCQGGRDAT